VRWAVVTYDLSNLELRLDRDARNRGGDLFEAIFQALSLVLTPTPEAAVEFSFADELPAFTVVFTATLAVKCWLFTTLLPSPLSDDPDYLNAASLGPHTLSAAHTPAQKPFSSRELAKTRCA